MSDEPFAIERVGEVKRDTYHAQHRDWYRKALLRRQLLAFAMPGAVYVPFIGDGDLAVELYADRPIAGADIEPDRVATARTRLPKARIITADCNLWPFPGLRTPIAVADFDAWDYPYHAWRAFAEGAVMADTVVVFFTDAQRMPMQRHGIWTEPDGTRMVAQLPTDNPSRRGGGKPDVAKIRRPFNAWFTEHLRPWFFAECDRIGYEAGVIRHYPVRTTAYWGAVITRAS
jgi:hypothetical protein